MISIFLILGSPSKIIPFFVNLISILLVISGVFKLTLANKFYLGSLEYNFDVIEGTLFILFGVILLQFHEFMYVTVIAGLILSIVPILRFIKSINKQNIMLFDSLKYFAVLILIFNNSLTKKGLCITLGLLSLLISCYISKTLVDKLLMYKKEGGVCSE